MVLAPHSQLERSQAEVHNLNEQLDQAEERAVRAERRLLSDERKCQALQQEVEGLKAQLEESKLKSEEGGKDGKVEGLGVGEGEGHKVKVLKRGDLAEGIETEAGQAKVPCQAKETYLALASLLNVMALYIAAAPEFGYVGVGSWGLGLGVGGWGYKSWG